MCALFVNPQPRGPDVKVALALVYGPFDRSGQVIDVFTRGGRTPVG